MSAFPKAPVPLREFIEETIPSLFAEIELSDLTDAFDLKLGVALSGTEGGEWTLDFVHGELEITEGLAEDCALTVLQSVVDWRAGLWEGRPSLVADAVAQIVDGGGPGQNGLANPDALRELENLRGRIDAIIEADAEPDWRIGIRLGPGPISEDPDATIKIGIEQAEAIRRGELHPLEALITGQLRLEGDLGLILQLQAIAMAASMPAPPRR